MPPPERTFFPMPGECLCAAAGLVGVIVVLWLMSSPGAPPHPMRLAGPVAGREHIVNVLRVLQSTVDCKWER